MQCKLTCIKCRNYLIKEEEYYDISLPIPITQEKKNPNELINPEEKMRYYNERHELWSKIQRSFSEDRPCVNLYDCLLNFCLPEDIKEQISCMYCKEKTYFRREVKILKPPNILMVVVKRFKFNQIGSKISKYVQFPINLDLRYFLQKNASCQYQLTGLIQHIGEVNAGHYISYCKNSKTNSWYEYDDSLTCQISEQQLLEKEAYILFYQKQLPEARKKFKTGGENVFLSSYWINLYYTISDPGIISQEYLICPHGNVKSNLSLLQFTSVSIQQYEEVLQKYQSDFKEIKSISSCEKCLLKFSALSLRVEMELELFNELNGILPFEGPWFLISVNWINHWKNFCALNYTGNRFLPNPVDNQILFEENGFIKKGLQAGKDYRGINRHVWAAFIYLYSGGPEIKRLEVDIYSKPSPFISCMSPDLTEENISKIKIIKSTYPTN